MEKWIVFRGCQDFVYVCPPPHLLPWSNFTHIKKTTMLRACLAFWVVFIKYICQEHITLPSPCDSDQILQTSMIQRVRRNLHYIKFYLLFTYQTLGLYYNVSVLQLLTNHAWSIVVLEHDLFSLNHTSIETISFMSERNLPLYFATARNLTSVTYLNHGVVYLLYLQYPWGVTAKSLNRSSPHWKYS